MGLHYHLYLCFQGGYSLDCDSADQDIIALKLPSKSTAVSVRQCTGWHYPSPRDGAKISYPPVKPLQLSTAKQRDTESEPTDGALGVGEHL
ncbi:hypothetical protein FKM82_023574 [Ascaphus truei]